MTGEHAKAIVQQFQLELTYINDPDSSPDATRGSIDNILDIIDIVQSDPNLAEMATQDGVSGFSPLADAVRSGTAHLENDVQTVFTANFIAQSNSLGQQAVNIVGSGDAKAIAALIDNLKAFEKSVSEFDAAQGGNALIDASGALGAEVAAMIKGLQTGDATLLTAAADQMHGNAADVGGNNVPVTGGTYNTDGVTVTEVLGTAPVVEATGRRSREGAGPAHAAAPPSGVEPVTLATVDVTVAVEDQPIRACPIWRIITSYVGIAARGAASSFPMLRGCRRPIHRVKNAFADPAHAADAQKTFSSACARKERSLDDGPNDGIGDHHWYGSDIGGWGNRRGCCPGSEVAGRMREAA